METEGRPHALCVDHVETPNQVPAETPPTFSWRLPATFTQSAYRIQVARTANGLEGATVDCWDSRRVESGRSINVTYAGPPLSADEQYHWRVRVWDDDGMQTAWSEPTSFQTAPDPTGWEGEWITHQPNGGDSNGFRGRWRPDDFAGEEWVQVDLGNPQHIDQIELHPACPFDGPETPDGLVISSLFSRGDFDHPNETRGPEGFGFPAAYRVEVADDASFEDPTVVAERREAEHHGPSARIVDISSRARFVRVTATDLYVAGPDLDEGVFHSTNEELTRERHATWRVFALAALAVRDETGEDLAEDAAVTASTSIETEAWGREKLVDGRTDSTIAAPSPQLRTEFELEQPVERARLHVAALGWGETSVNGEPLDAAALNPAWTDYDERILYQTYDVGETLRVGSNAIGVWLGRGWFAKNDYAWTGFGSPRANVCLRIEYQDGTTTRVVTGDQWEVRASPIAANDIYDGEYFDASVHEPEWTEPGFDAGDWTDSVAVQSPEGRLRPHRLEPVAPVERFSPASIEEHEGGWIIDFGQNLTGYLELDVTGLERGEEVRLTHAESRTEDGRLATEDLRSADAVDTYLVAGAEAEAYRPRFTYHGFRYARIDGYPGELTQDDVTAVAVHTAVPKRGSFSCANEELNAVQHAAEWSLRGNTFGIPTGCAQRDERTGWTGDAHLSARALLYGFDAGRFHAKWADDHVDAQSTHGHTPDTVPYVHGGRPGDPAWTLTRLVIPWYHYQFYGDDRILREHYNGMRRHVEYWHSLAEDGYLACEYGSYGDWLAFENTGEPEAIGEPIDLFITASHFRATQILAATAETLGYHADTERYERLAADIREGFNDRFFDPERDMYEPGTQAAQAVALYEGIVPERRASAVAANLAEQVRGEGRLLTGFLGTRALLYALTDHGYVDLAYDLVSSPEQPGWVYMVREGATTLWERWNSDEAVGSGMNSFNHHQFAYVSEWFFACLLGLRFQAGECANGIFQIAPRVPSSLGHAEGSVDTRHGTVTVAWAHDGPKWHLEVSVPGNTEGIVRLPLGDLGGEVIAKAGKETIWTPDDGSVHSSDVAPSVIDGDRDGVRVRVGPGSHQFVLQPQ